MKRRRWCAGAVAALGLAAVMVGVLAPSSRAQSACVWAKEQAIVGPSITAKVNSDGTTCPAANPPAGDPCPDGPVGDYQDTSVSPFLTGGVVFCVETVG